MVLLCGLPGGAYRMFSRLPFGNGFFYFQALEPPELEKLRASAQRLEAQKVTESARACSYYFHYIVSNALICTI